MKNPKAKGSGWEREISRMLSLWWTEGKDKNVFMRSASSGAWNTMHRKEGVTAHSGDIEAVDSIGRPFTNHVMVETKWYKEETSLLFEILLCKRTQILAWWGKCEKEATDVMKIPMLIVKFNYQIPFLVVPNYFYSEIYETFGEPLLFPALILQLNFDDTIYKHLIVMRLDEFLNWCKPEFFIKRTKVCQHSC